MGYIVYKHKNFMLSEVSNQCRVQFPSLLAASVPLAHGGGLPPLARGTHSCCYPVLLQTRPVKPHVLSMIVTPLTSPSCHATAWFATHAHSVIATALHPLQKQSCWPQHGTSVWSRTLLPAAPQKDIWKTFLFVFNSKQHLSHTYCSVPVTITELGSPQL